MKRKMRNILIGLVVGLAFVNVCCTAISLLWKDIWDIKFLYEANIMVAVMSISAGLIFKEGVSPLELWIRRAVVMIMWCILEPICLLVFGHFNHGCGHTNYDMLLKTMLISTPIVVAVFVACYIIGDRLEKKHLDIINKKLSENEEK